jgi:hypothetical protein
VIYVSGVGKLTRRAVKKFHHSRHENDDLEVIALDITKFMAVINRMIHSPALFEKS